jgi:ribosome biogenesis GTPase
MACLSPKERKEVVRKANELRAAAQKKTKDPVGSVEDFLLNLLAPSEAGKLVLAVDIAAALLEDAGRMRFSHRTRPVVGDRVHVDDTRRTIRSIIERKSEFSCNGAVVAANLQQVAIVASVISPPFRAGLIDRYFSVIRSCGLRPMLIVNKVDLAAGAEEHLAPIRPFERLGVPVHLLSALEGNGVDALARDLAPYRTALVGHSGVGKSSLVNALLGSETARTGDVGLKSGKGTHTTTSSRLYALPGGGEIIDTAGVRLLEVDSNSAEDGFTEFAELAGGCRFPDCSHLDEPGCAVKMAVQAGTVQPARYAAYRRLRLGEEAPTEGFVCVRCGANVSHVGAGSKHRNHCPRCLWSRHLDHVPGDRNGACGDPMEPVAVWVRNDGEWALIHRCTGCGVFHSNRVAGDDREAVLLSLAAKPLASPPFPLEFAHVE